MSKTTWDAGVVNTGDGNDVVSIKRANIAGPVDILDQTSTLTTTTPRR